MAVIKANAKPADSFAEFLGVSAPEVPKYLVLNNFLTNYFKVNTFVRDEITDFEKNGRVFTQENDEFGRKGLQQAFNTYFDSYSGYLEYISRMRKGKKPWFYPVIPDMLTTTEQFPLRHLLYALQVSGTAKYSDTQKNLYNYLYGNQNDIHNIFRFICGPVAEFDETRLPVAPERDFGGQAKQPFFRQLSKRFNTTLNQILKNDYLLKADFFTRIEFLGNFLTLYVMEYVLERTNVRQFKTKNIFLCKGSNNPNLLSGPFHKACISTYSNIRARFPELLKMQFVEIVDKIETDFFDLYTCIDDDDDTLSLCIHYGGQRKELIDFLVEHRIASPRGDAAKSKLILNYLQLLQGKARARFSKEDFALQCFNIQKKNSGSTINKVSSILPTMGREINFVYPRNRAKQKYFALSEELATFLVRLYLIHIDQAYAYFDDFVLWLNQDYHIYFSLDVKSELKNYLNAISADIPMFDLNKNEQEFIKTLANVNCLIRLSDSGYLVVLPDRKGGMRLL